MNQIPPVVHIMTAGLTPGDAIGNFIVSSSRILHESDSRVYLYADYVAPHFSTLAKPSRFYPNNGQDFLWYHYSIYADNIEEAINSRDYKIMDFHGISPSHLYAGQNESLATLCQKGLDLLPTLKDVFDGYVVHSEYTRQWLESLGYPADKIVKIPLCIDTAVYPAPDAELATSLSQLDYLLMVGRIVPQKDVTALIEIFSHVHRQRPDMALILVGGRVQAGKYQRQLERLIAQKKLQNRVLFTGQINNRAVLAALFSYARLLLVTSEWESFCVPVAESLHFGVPTAVHQIPPLPEVAGPAGLVFDKANPRQTAAQILELLADNGRYQQMSQTARDWAIQYTDEALAQNMKALFNHLNQMKENPNAA